jgi:hypothetical protein
MRAVLFTVCETAILDSQTMAFSLINVFTELAVAAFPVVIPKIAIAAIVEKAENDPSSLDCRIQVFLNDQELLNTPGSFDFQGKMRVQVCMLVQGIVLPGPGDLRFSLIHNQAETPVTLSNWVVTINALGPQADMFAGAVQPQPHA